MKPVSKEDKRLKTKRRVSGAELKLFPKAHEDLVVSWNFKDDNDPVA